MKKVSKVSMSDKIRKIKFSTGVKTWLEGEGDPKIDKGDHPFECEAYVFKGITEPGISEQSLNARFHKLFHRGIDITGIIHIPDSDIYQNDMHLILDDLAYEKRDLFYNEYYSEAVPAEHIAIEHLSTSKYFPDSKISFTVNYVRYTIVKRPNQREDHKWDEITEVQINNVSIKPGDEIFPEAYEAGICYITDDGDYVERDVKQIIAESPLFKTKSLSKGGAKRVKP